MVKNCCVVRCHNVYINSSGIHFYRFLHGTENGFQVVWVPNNNMWICSEHFVTGAWSNNPLAPNYVPTIFPYTDSPVKRKLHMML